MNQKIKITVIGAGNGGQAIAGHCAILGYSTCLYNRDIEKLGELRFNNSIELYGAINGTGILTLVTDNIKEAITFGDIIFVATTATAHKEIAQQIKPFLKEEQLLILTPGRTGGVLEIGKILCNNKIYLAEAQTLMYACRKEREGLVHIIGVKDKVFFAGRNKKETTYIQHIVSQIYPCLLPADSLLHTSLENIGAIFHPSVIMFNAAAIERGSMFYFYREMTPQIAQFIQRLDNERINIGKAYHINLISASEWVSYAYPNISGSTLCEKMQNNPAYYDILAPKSIFSRQLLEDIPTGLLPMTELARAAKIETPLMSSIITVCSNLLNIDFYTTGRTLKDMGLDNMDKYQILKKLQ